MLASKLEVGEGNNTPAPSRVARDVARDVRLGDEPARVAAPETGPGPSDHLPSPYAVAQALPEGSVLPATAAAWLARVFEHPDFDLVRPDGRENLQALVGLLASATHAESRTTMPQWKHLQANSGLSKRTVARWLLWLRLRGLLAVVVTPATRSRAKVLDNDHNDGAVYALCVPTRPAYGLVPEPAEPAPVPEAAAELD